MDILKWVEILITVLAGLAACIPLAIKLVAVVKESAEKSNWNEIVKIVLAQMVEAEKNYTEGAAKKAWVMNQVRVLAKSLEYNYTEIEEAKVSAMIDAICEAAKIINVEPIVLEQVD